METYKYETHLHTSEGSRCGGCSGEQMALAAKKAGYAGIIVTDHNWGGNTAIDLGLSWEDFVYAFLKGYENAKKVGDEIGLSVFWGWEAGYQGTEFLIYGLSGEWMLKHPEIRDASIEEQFALVKQSGGIVVHAHPYREETYIPKIRLFPEFVDAVEVVNAMHSNPKSKAHFHLSYNARAYEYAKRYAKPMTAGSDIHTADLLGGGMIFSRPLTDIHDFINAVLNQEALSLTDGYRCWDMQKLKNATADFNES